MRTTITEALVKTAKCGFIRDDKLIGFALRTTANGFKSFIVDARVNGRMRRFALSPADRMSVVEARNEARQILARMTKGDDPVLARQARRERSRTLSEMLDEYLAARQVKVTTVEKYRAVLRRTMPDWLDKPIAEITPAMVRVRYEALIKHSVSEANNAMRVLRAVSRRAAIVLPERADGLPAIKVIPTVAIGGAWATLERRSRVLEPHEIGAWFNGVQGLYSERSKRALMALLLTGLRAQEALKLDWRNVEEDKRRLAIADSKTGGFVKIIGPQLAGMFETWRKLALSEGRGVRGPVFKVNDLRSALERVEKAGGKAITPHDLRRTFASFAERAGAPITTLKVLMNHSTRGDVTMGYVRPSEADLLHWASVIEGAILTAGQVHAVISFSAAAREATTNLKP